MVHRLDYTNNRVHASIAVTYSTNQTRGWVNTELVPEEKVFSYTLA
ncbi:MAG: hypothetical protein ACR2GU_12230 [Rubrobacteraceae bacterium]